MRNLFGLFTLGLLLMSTSASFAQQVGVGYKSDGSDVSGDFSEAEGDGASVSADVTVGFKIGKKVALAVHSGSPVIAPVFQEAMRDAVNAVGSEMFIDNLTTQKDSSDDTLLAQSLAIRGLVYTNTENTTFSVTPQTGAFTHIDGAAAGEVGIGKCATEFKQLNGAVVYPSTDCTSGSGITMVSSSDLVSTNGTALFDIDLRFAADTFDATDRAGEYYSTISIDVNLP